MLDRGDRIGPCRVEELLGAGGMGTVARCVDERLDRSVAVKVLDPSVLEADGGGERFVREARLRAAAAVRAMVAAPD